MSFSDSTNRRYRSDMKKDILYIESDTSKAARKDILVSQPV